MIVKMQSVPGVKAGTVVAISIAMMEGFQILLSFSINFAGVQKQKSNVSVNI